IEKHRFARHRDHGAFESFTLLGSMRVSLFILRKDIAERLVGFVVGLGSRGGSPVAIQHTWVGHEMLLFHCGIIPTGISRVPHPLFRWIRRVKPQGLLWLLVFGGLVGSLRL